MNAEQLGEIYTQVCHAMTRAGEDSTELFLSRLVLLLMHEIGEPERIRKAIEDAEAVGGQTVDRTARGD